jgi:hypothetical protein
MATKKAAAKKAAPKKRRRRFMRLVNPGRGRHVHEYFILSDKTAEGLQAKVNALHDNAEDHDPDDRAHLEYIGSLQHLGGKWVREVERLRWTMLPAKRKARR